MQDLVELHEVDIDSPLEPVKVPLDVILSFQDVNCTTQVGIISKLPEDALNPTAHVAEKATEQSWSQYCPLRDITDLHLDFEPLPTTLCVAVQLIHYPLSGPLIKSMYLQIGDKDVL